MTDLNTFRLLTPELILVLLAIWIMVASAFRVSRWGWSTFAAIGLLVVGIALWRLDGILWSPTALPAALTSQSSTGPLFIDWFGHWGRWLSLAIAVLFLPMAAESAKSEFHGEFLGASLLSCVGLMIVATAQDMVLLLLGLELISIPTYVILFLVRDQRVGIEATAKYFFMSILSSAMFLYGLSFLYGAGGSTSLLAIRETLAHEADPIGSTFLPWGLVLMFAGLGFKLAAVPFHFYAPDVYQATTHAGAGLLSVLPKAAGILAMIRLAVSVEGASSGVLWQVLIVMSIVSMTWGNACALWQRDLRRMLAYSSVAHAGYMLIGVATGVAAADRPLGYDGYGAALFYVGVYSIASLGTFAALAFLSNTTGECNHLDDLDQLALRHPWIAATLSVFMFSLSGIPPLAGFWGKLALFTPALSLAREGTTSPWFMALLIVAALNAAVGAGYYLRVIGAIYFGANEAKQSRSRQPSGSATEAIGLAGVTAVVCCLLVLASGLVPGRLLTQSSQAGRSAQSSSP